MNCSEHDVALKDLGVNLEPICPTTKNGVFANYHKAGTGTVLLIPAESLSIEQRIAQVEEVRRFMQT